MLNELISLSKSKFSSNVLEKVIKYNFIGIKKSVLNLMFQISEIKQ